MLVRPVPIPRCERQAITDRLDAADIADRMLANDPTDRTDSADPMLPMLSTDPTDPIDRAEFVEPMLRIEFRDR